MPRAAKYVELVLPHDPSLPRWLAGMEVVSDYTSDGRRHLFLKRPDASAPVPAPTAKSAAKSRRPRKPRTNSDASPQPSVAFPGAGVGNG